MFARSHVGFLVTCTAVCPVLRPPFPHLAIHSLALSARISPQLGSSANATWELPSLLREIKTCIFQMAFPSAQKTGTALGALGVRAAPGRSGPLRVSESPRRGGRPHGAARAPGPGERRELHAAAPELCGRQVAGGTGWKGLGMGIN